MRVTLKPALLLLGLGLCLGACGGSSKPTIKKTSHGNSADTSEAGKGTDNAAATAAGPVSFVKASPKACMLHAEAEGYFRCLTGTGGECFHFGATCAPPALCMYEKKSKLHKTCTKEVEGRCASYGATCEPADSCMFDPSKKRYRKCESAKGGTCSRFGDTCLPAA